MFGKVPTNAKPIIIDDIQYQYKSKTEAIKLLNLNQYKLEKLLENI